MGKVLVVYHSSSGTTRKVGQAIARELSADVEEIREVNPVPVDIKGKGLRNFMNMGRVVLTALRRQTVPIQEVQHNPEDYDLVVLGTPRYAGSLPGPTRAYVTQNARKFREVAFFGTGLDPNPEQRIFQQMAQACGKKPKAVSNLVANKVVSGEFLPQVKEFVSKLA